MLGKHFIRMRNTRKRATKPETMPISKVSHRNFYVAIGSTRRIHIALTYLRALKHLFQKDKNKKIDRLSELSWICSLDRPCMVYRIARLRKKVRACTLGYPTETCWEICMHGLRPPRSACEMRRLDKKCIFGPPEGLRRRRLCISRLFSALFSLLVAKNRSGDGAIKI